jgi:F420-dependent oxidoreductase-like protein
MPTLYSAGMRIGLWIETNSVDEVVRDARRAKEAGFRSLWAGQIFHLDTLTTFAVAGHEVPGLEWGTGVVPTYPRHPLALALQAITTNAAVGGGLTLGIGPSHQIVVEAIHGLDYSRPASHVEEYLKALVPLLREGRVSSSGEQVTAHATIGSKEGLGVPVLVAALAPRMLRLAGTLADGTITWMVGPKTIAGHISPSIRAAAEQAGRPDPRVVMALPVAVTDDVAAARAKAAETFSIYGTLPAYRAVLDREGAEGPADVAIVGGADEVADRIRALEDAGVTEFAMVPFVDARRTVEELAGRLLG